MAYVSTSAPLVFLDLPSGGVAGLAERAEVLSLGLEQTWSTFMASAGVTVGANWTSGNGDQGNGVRVAVVEYANASNGGDLAGQVVERFSTNGNIVTHIHPTWVAGAIASKSVTWRGVAPGADVVSAGTGNSSPGLSTDRAVIAATDWAVSPSGGDADIVNTSFGQDTSTGAEEGRRYFDSVGWEDNRLVVASSGNFSTFGNWNVVSPGTGYNVLTVGGVNDRNSGGTGDDILWFGSDGASYRDPDGTAWNPHGDFNKPNLSAPAVSVRTANGTIGDGTSISSPIVAGIGAQLLARSPSLATWPEAARAVLMAGANRRTPLPGGGFSRDHEGVGTASARWSNRVLDNGLWGGWTFGIDERGPDRDPRHRGRRRASRSASRSPGAATRPAARTLARPTCCAPTSTWSCVSRTARPRGPSRSTTRTRRSTSSPRAPARCGSRSATIASTRRASPTASPGRSAARSPTSAPRPSTTTSSSSPARASPPAAAPRLFCPTASVTRGEMAAFLDRALDLPSTSQDHFTDDDSSTFEDSINAVAEAGIASGCADDRFCPNRVVTRGEMASFLAAAFDVPPSSVDHFGDDDSSIHEDDINAIASAGLASGCTSSRYCPTHSVSREQMAAFLNRAL